MFLLFIVAVLTALHTGAEFTGLNVNIKGLFCLVGSEPATQRVGISNSSLRDVSNVEVYQKFSVPITVFLDEKNPGRQAIATTLGPYIKSLDFIHIRLDEQVC
jgi:hypothetical protein